LPPVIGGDSAGGNLAAVDAQTVHDKGGITAQILVYPVTDPDSESFQRANDPSVLAA